MLVRINSRANRALLRPARPLLERRRGWTLSTRKVEVRLSRCEVELQDLNRARIAAVVR